MATGNDEQRSEGAFRSARRRLVKGSFSVPAVMTLATGRALAMTTAEARSLAKDVDAGYPHTLPLVVAGSPTDTWIREQSYKGRNGSSGVPYFIKASQLTAHVVPGAGTSFMTGTQSLCVVSGSISSNNYAAGNVYNFDAPTGFGRGSYYALLYDHVGTIKAISGTTLVNSPVFWPSTASTANGLGGCHQSVWASIIL